jgi:hypothetical protein
MTLYLFTKLLWALKNPHALIFFTKGVNADKCI